MPRLSTTTIALLLGLLPVVRANGEGAIETRLAQRTDRFLAEHCAACHSGEHSEGRLRLESLSRDLSELAVERRWRQVRDRVARGEMPPSDQPSPTASDQDAFLAAVTELADAAANERRARQGRVVLRRLNRLEYEHTIEELLGVQVDFGELLPPDGAAEGFDNVGDALHLSPFLLERYLEAAERALDLAIANGPAPASIKQRYGLQETHQVRSTTERVFRKQDDGAVTMFASSAWQAVSLSPFYPPDGGDYRFRLAVSATQSAGKPVTFKLDAGLMLMTGRPHLVGYFDAPPDETRVIELVDHLEPRNTIRLLPYGLASAQAVNQVGAEAYDGPGLTVHWIEVEGPLHDRWPPESHRRLFGELPQSAVAGNGRRDRVEVVSESPRADAEPVLRAFVRRAFRRVVDDQDVAPFLALFDAKLAEGRTFEQSLRVALAGVLVAPDFLFLRERPGELDDFALASRLAYFLRCGPPDAELLERAAAGRLRDPAVLRAETDRLLDSPDSARFVRDFVGQWLGLRDIDFTMPSHILYPEYDEMLKLSMVREAELYFAELLRDDLGVERLVASDFSMLNGRLAKHYAIPGVEGWEFRRVALPPDSHRGGVMTMAAVLKVTANGTHSSPVVRGAWVLDRLLGNPPPPPPQNVSPIEPDIRGATTIREQLAKHRELESCAVCHRSIDPPGFALESFDVIGGYREWYRSSGNGKPVTIDGKRMHYAQGRDVDPADTLEDGRAFRNVDELKALLAAAPLPLARALVRRLATYSTGGPPEPIDDRRIDAIVESARDQGLGVRTLLHAVVQSELFRHK